MFWGCQRGTNSGRPRDQYFSVGRFFSKCNLTIIVFIDKISEFFDFHLFIALIVIRIFNIIIGTQKK